MSNNNRTPIEPTPNDVIIGRKATAKKQIGNQLVDQLAEQKKDAYRHAFYRQEKRLVAQDIIEEITKISGRFLEAENNDSVWYYYEMDHEKIIIKVCKILRAFAKNAADDRASQEEDVHPAFVQEDAHPDPVEVISSATIPLEDENVRKREINSEDAEDSKKTKYEPAVVTSISFLGKSYVTRPMFNEMFRPESRRLIESVADLDEGEDGMNQLPSVIGNLLMRIEELEEEVQVSRGRIPL